MKVNLSVIPKCKRKMPSSILSPNEAMMVKTFRTCCRIDNITLFTSDDFRGYGLTRFMKRDKKGRLNIGILFYKMKLLKIAEPVGWKPSQVVSSHSRKNQMWRWIKQ